MSWEFDNSIPIYIQLVKRIKMLIISGELNSDDKIASVRDLAQEAGVNPNTMQRALSELEREGLIYSVRTCGRFVTKDIELIKEMKENFARQKIDELFETLLMIGYTQDEISSIILKKTKTYRKGE